MKKRKTCYVCGKKPVIKLREGICEKCIHEFNNPPK